ncbi:MAG: hypothetical protein GX556_17405 [Fibrobacter sp.]|nr:hypothetical protein [Fibrobacter sp.]
MSGKRYSDQEKKKVIDFVKRYDAENGRGGMSQASKKFKVAPLTLRAWLDTNNGKAKAAVKKASKKVPEARTAKKETPVTGIKESVLKHVENIERYQEQISKLQALIAREKEEIQRKLT